MPSFSPATRNVCLYICPIGAPGSPERQRADIIYEDIIRIALQQLKLDLTPLRDDEMTDPGRISEAIIKTLIGAPAVIADIAGHNTNVYYEIAIRMAAGKSIIFINDSTTTTPFYLKDFRIITIDHLHPLTYTAKRNDLKAHLPHTLKGDDAHATYVSTLIRQRYITRGELIDRHDAVYDSITFSGVAGFHLSSHRPYALFYSHKGAVAKHSYQLLTSRNILRKVGEFQTFRIPGFPQDEAETIMRIWYLVVDPRRLNFDQVQPLCSCVVHDDENRTAALRRSFTIIGSPKENEVCESLMKTIVEMKLKVPYIMQVTDTDYDISVEMRQEGSDCNERRTEKLRRAQIVNINNNEDRYSPTQWDPGRLPTTDKELVDFAIMMRMPNILDSEMSSTETILLIAGCKVAGQEALGRWITHTENLRRMAAFGEQPFFAILKVPYRYGEGSPIILYNDVVEVKELQSFKM